MCFRFILVSNLAIFLLSCDVADRIAEDADACPEPGPGQVSYFPLKEGDLLTFDHEYGRSPGLEPGAERNIGTLTWTVQESGECEEGKMLVHVSESFEGHKQQIRYSDEDPQWRNVSTVSWQRKQTFEVGDSLDLGDYSHWPIAWINNDETPDTVQIDQVDGMRSRIALTLVRDRGMVVNHFTERGSPGGGGACRTSVLRD